MWKKVTLTYIWFRQIEIKNYLPIGPLDKTTNFYHSLKLWVLNAGLEMSEICSEPVFTKQFLLEVFYRYFTLGIWDKGLQTKTPHEGDQMKATKTFAWIKFKFLATLFPYLVRIEGSFVLLLGTIWFKILVF